MRLQRGLVPEHLAAIAALELRLLVGGHVLSQTRDGFRSLSAVGALVLLVGGMVDDGVLSELALIGESHTTDGACRRHHFALVDCCHMRSQLSGSRELLGTPINGEEGHCSVIFSLPGR